MIEKYRVKRETGTPDPLDIMSDVEEHAEKRDFYKRGIVKGSKTDERIASAMVILLPESSQVERAVRHAGLLHGATTFSITEDFEREYITLPSGGVPVHWKSRRKTRYFMKLYRWCDECLHNYGAAATLDPFAKEVEERIKEDGMTGAEGLEVFSRVIAEEMKRLSPSMICPEHGVKQIVEPDQPTE
jgi:hypothetical protein